ncbi:MAG: 4-hydroxy-tetrahydrodipicolinate reductase [Bacteroidales bacterium]
MKILISGYGRMGREIETLAIQQGHEIAGIYDKTEDWDENPQPLKTCDVVIDFSRPVTAPENIRRCLVAHKPIVVGTTGWHDHLPELTQLCSKMQGAIFYAPNFSLGINIFLQTAEALAKALNAFHYEASIREIHHIHKEDAPSGTAIALAARIISQMEQYQSWQLVMGDHADEGKLPVHAVREGEVTGFHEVTFSSGSDVIRLSHEALNRSGFALGALAAARWILNRRGVFTMKDMLSD